MRINSKEDRHFLQQRALECKNMDPRNLAFIGEDSRIRHSMTNRLEASGDLNAKTHTGQMFKDVGRYHLRTDGIPQTIGAAPLSVAVPVLKIGNHVGTDIINLFRDRGNQIATAPLQGGDFKYTSRDVRSLVGNTADAAKNILTLHPIRALGNLGKAGLDGVDLIVDPFLDAASIAARHSDPKPEGSVYAQHELN